MSSSIHSWAEKPSWLIVDAKLLDSEYVMFTNHVLVFSYEWKLELTKWPCYMC